jgi:hypothetical protein
VTNRPGALGAYLLQSHHGSFLAPSIRCVAKRKEQQFLATPLSLVLRRCCSRPELRRWIDLRPPHTWISCRDARGQAPVQEELGPDIGRASSVCGFHWERGKRARTAVVPAAAYLPARLEDRTEGWAKAAASTTSIAWIETRYGNSSGAPDATASDPGGVSASL